MIKWEEIEFPDNWKTQNAVLPTPIINKTIEQIVKTQEGDIYLNFKRNRTLPYKVSLLLSSARPSVARSSTASVESSEPREE